MLSLHPHEHGSAFMRASARSFCSRGSVGKGGSGRSVTSLGVNARGSLAQRGSGAPSGAGLSLGWRGFRAQASATISTSATATHRRALGEGRGLARGGASSLEFGFVEDIRVHTF